MKIEYNYKKRSLVVFDLDGTLINFKRIDNSIISELFKDNWVISTLDKLLWKINDMDYISNCYGIFKARIGIYSLFSGYQKEELMKLYGKKYIELAMDETIEKYNHIKNLENLGYEVIIVTHNIFADGLNNYVPVTFALNKRKYFTGELLEKYNVIYVVGNNYVDDIKSAYLVKAYPIYIGKSKVVKRIIKGKAKNVENLFEAMKFIVSQHTWS